MTTDPADTDAWDGERSRRWVEQSAGLERQLAPVSELLFATARLQPGEAVVDVGCGTGPTTYEAAALVAPGGRVVGVDVSATMLEAACAAQQPTDRPPVAPIDWVTADVTMWPGDGGPFDAVISRFGVMFFEDPAAAFANLARITAADGRLAMAVWPQRTESDMFELPLAATMRTLAAAGVAAKEPAVDQGPFSLCDRVTVTAMLTDAGWSDVEWAPHDLTMSIGGGLAPADAAAGSMALGPTRIVMAEVDDDDAARRVLKAITRDYEGHTGGDGHVVLGARVIIVSARRAA